VAEVDLTVLGEQFGDLARAVLVGRVVVAPPQESQLLDVHQVLHPPFQRLEVLVTHRPDGSVAASREEGR
jgi:hypothetical protein